MSMLKIGKKTFDLDKRTLIMGILNVTPDSFSDGGKHFSTDDAVKHALLMEKRVQTSLILVENLHDPVQKQFLWMKR